MDPYLISVIALFCALPLVWWLARRTGPTERKEQPAERMDTLAAWPPEATRVLRSSERVAFSTLKLALPGYMILAQVPIARFLNVPEAQFVCGVDAPPRQPVRRLRDLRRHLAGDRRGRDPAAASSRSATSCAPGSTGWSGSWRRPTSRCMSGTRSACRRSRSPATSSCRARRPCPPSMDKKPLVNLQPLTTGAAGRDGARRWWSTHRLPSQRRPPTRSPTPTATGPRSEVIEVREPEQPDLVRRARGIGLAGAAAAGTALSRLTLS